MKSKVDKILAYKPNIFIIIQNSYLLRKELLLLSMLILKALRDWLKL